MDEVFVMVVLAFIINIVFCIFFEWICMIFNQCGYISARTDMLHFDFSILLNSVPQSVKFYPIDRHSLHLLWKSGSEPFKMAHKIHHYELHFMLYFMSLMLLDVLLFLSVFIILKLLLKYCSLLVRNITTI